MNKIAILVCALLLAAGTNPVLAAPHLPDPSTGSIGNEQAILVWPIDSGTGALQDAHDCVVHVVNEAGEQTYACGSWFKPSRGQHSVWLETADQISNERVSMTYGGGKFPGIGKQLLLPTVAAGFVRIDTSNVSQTVDTLRVLSLAATGFPVEPACSP
jgi:hypothetical protein